MDFERVHPLSGYKNSSDLQKSTPAGVEEL
jgi:hypothetical protein